MTMNKSCIIYYDGHDKYSEIKDLSAINEERQKPYEKHLMMKITTKAMRHYTSYNKS